MKRNTILLIGLLAIVISTMADNVSVRTAQIAAQSFMSQRIGIPQQLNMVDFADRSEFPNLYVFGNGRCFVIIAGDDAVHPVLGYSTEDGFDTEEMCIEVRDWLKSYDDQIALVKTDRLAATEEIFSEWNDLMNGRGLEPKSRTVVCPLIRTKWSHKRVPFNNFCPEAPNGPGGHCVGGCGTVAMAQFLKYWEHPIRGVGEHSYTPHAHPEFGVQYANFGETVYDWDNMLNDYFHGYSDVEASAVATLLYHCGVSVDINYGDTASGTNPPDVDTALWTYFNYTHNSHYLRKINYTDAQWIAMLKSDLDLERPVIYRGKNQQTDVGHIFICDGYDEYDYFHFVLGWGGNYDGYYSIGAIHPSYDMNYLNGAVFGSYPNTPSISPPNNITTTVSGQNVIINWSPVSGASHYRLYRDGDLVAAHLNNSSYTDHNVNYGTHFYYVKSVKNDGTMSLKSSKAFAEIHFSGPIPTNMQANTNGHNVNLSWQTPNTESSILHYGLGEPSTSGAGANTQGDRTYWAQRYSASVLMANAGMAIEKVSFYSRRAGEYTVGLYKGDVATITEFICQQNYTATAGSWQDIVFTQPVPIDYTQDLWVVFYSDVYKPASYCSYSGPNVADASLYSQSGVSSWSRLNDRSWLIKTYLTDGTYTYNLYRDGNAVANNLTGNTYTDANLADGFYDYHVTTNYFGGESDPSNTVHVQVGNPTYTISASADPTNGGSVTGAGTYNYGQTCTLTATPATGYDFVNWTKNGTQVSTNANYSFTVTEAASYVAHFQIQSYTISASTNPSNGGSVSGGGTYNYGETCTLTATAANGYNFLNWTESGSVVSSYASYSFTVNANRSLVANFSLDNFVVAVSVDPSNGGSVTGGGAFHYGDNCTVVATANPGYNFVNWTENGTQVSTLPNYSFTVTDNRTLVAHFTSQNYVITATADPENGGVVSGAGGYNYGETCHLTATANAGFEFTNWTKNGSVVSTNPSYSFTVTESANYVAHFTAQGYTINVSASPIEGGSVSGGGTFTHGQTCTVHATVNPCYRFVNWTENGNVVSTQADYSFTVTGNRDLVANFALETYTVTVEIEPEEGGTVSGAGVYPCGESVILTAIPNDNYAFVGWFKDGNQISTNPTMVTIADDNRYFTARFAIIEGVGENDGLVEVYPNPANDVLYVVGDGIKKVTVFNALGQLMESIDFAREDQVRINTSNYESGLYVIRIETDGGNMMKQFVKQ